MGKQTLPKQAAWKNTQVPCVIRWLMGPNNTVLHREENLVRTHWPNVFLVLGCVLRHPFVEVFFAWVRSQSSFSQRMGDKEWVFRLHEWRLFPLQYMLQNVWLVSDSTAVSLSWIIASLLSVLCQVYELLKICSKNSKNSFKICSNYVQNMFKIC